jgi:hypothetical protein
MMEKLDVNQAWKLYLTVDPVCHGIAPHELNFPMLRKHSISMEEKPKQGKIISIVNFLTKYPSLDETADLIRKEVNAGDDFIEIIYRYKMNALLRPGYFNDLGDKGKDSFIYKYAFNAHYRDEFRSSVMDCEFHAYTINR